MNSVELKLERFGNIGFEYVESWSLPIAMSQGILFSVFRLNFNGINPNPDIKKRAFKTLKGEVDNKYFNQDEINSLRKSRRDDMIIKQKT